jgi:Ca2+-binding EF-hand superfamily protein
MADWIGEDQIKDLMIAFSKFDTDNEGLIGVHQLRRVLYTLGQNPTDAELQVINKNKSKCQIDEDEVEVERYFMNVSLDTIAHWELLTFSTDFERIVVNI